MRIAKKHSHLNGEEWLLVHEKKAYQEIQHVIGSIDAEQCRKKISKERNREGHAFYSPVALNDEFGQWFSELGWQFARYSYCVAHNFDQFETGAQMSLEEQKQSMLDQETEAVLSFSQTDHVKNRIAIGVQFGEYAFFVHNLFAKYLALYTGRIINVGIEILPTKVMQKEMSSGIAYYEGELHNILRHGRTNPPVPLVLIGLEP